MKGILRTAAQLGTTALVASFGFAAAPTGFAQQNSERQTQQTVAMSQKVYEALTEAQALVEAKQYEQAQTRLDVLLEEDNLEPYEIAQVWNLTAYALYQQERYGDAINAYDQVLAQPELPVGLQQTVLKTKSQLQLNVEDYKGALATVDRLMALVPEPAANVYYTRGAALFQLGEYSEALQPLRQAVDMTSATGSIPKEGWLLLLRGCYYELKDYRNMVAVLEELIRHYPKDTYLLTLAGAYSELGDTAKQLVIMESLYEQGFINQPAHITNLANLYLLHGAPFKAAELLESDIAAGKVERNERNLRLLSQAWFAARENEKSIPPLREAAELANDGELYVRLAQAYMNLEQWDQATKALQNGLKTGDLSREDTAHIMLGMAHFSQRHFDAARRAFEAAMRDERSRRAAQQWINYVDSELRRIEMMKQEVPEPAATERSPFLRLNEDPNPR